MRADVRQRKEPVGRAARPRVSKLEPLILLAATLVAYYPAWHGGVLWDDNAHLTRPELQSTAGLWRIWFDIGATQQYYPVTHSAFWVQNYLWGDATLGYHLVNVALHALSAFLVAMILETLSVPAAVLSAFLFALHPVHVESVAWMTELKNTLSGVFFLAAALAYLRYDEQRQTRRYVAALGLFILALLSKTVTAVLPAALLVIAWWRRGTIDVRRDVRPLLPFFAFGAAAGLLTAAVERTSIGAQGREFGFSIVERGLIAGRAVWFYLSTLVWPSNLIFNYPRWEIRSDVWWQYVYPIGVVAVIVALWAFRGRTRTPLAVALLFCGLLFPALGFVNVYPFRFSFVADHFAYLASLPIVALAGAAIATVLPMPSTRRAAAAALVLVLGVLTFQQSRHYASPETLYRDTIARNPASWLAHGNLGALMVADRPAEALAHLDEAVRLEPDAAEAHNDRGTALQRLDRVDEAVSEYREAVRLVPTFASARTNLANALLVLGQRLQESGRHGEAIGYYETALSLGSSSAEVHNNLGVALRETGHIDQALVHFADAVRLNPGYADAQFNLASTLHSEGRIDEAVPHYLEALKLNPADAAAAANLAVAREALRKRHQ